MSTDNQNDFSENVSEQALEKGKEYAWKAKKAASEVRKAPEKIKNTVDKTKKNIQKIKEMPEKMREATNKIRQASDMARRAAVKSKAAAQQMQTMARQAQQMLRHLIIKALHLAKTIATQLLNTIKAVGQLTINIIIGTWPIWLILLAILLAFAMYTGVKNDRGPFKLLSLDRFLPVNYTEQRTEARQAAVAFSEPQAILDAYYTYMSCNSITKVIAVDNYFKFNGDKDEVEDFAGLQDYYKRENYFYLSSEFLRYADEMFHKEEFYYPEQLIKPVYHEYVGNLSVGHLETLPLIQRYEAAADVEGLPVQIGSNPNSSVIGYNPVGSNVHLDDIIDYVATLGYSYNGKAITGEDVIYLSQSLYGEAGGLGPRDQSGVVWTMLNRYCSSTYRNLYGDSIPGQITAYQQFTGWRASNPVTEVQVGLVLDVLARWMVQEDTGADDRTVGRTLPIDYYDFRGDNKLNYFMKSWSGYIKDAPYSG